MRSAHLTLLAALVALVSTAAYRSSEAQEDSPGNQIANQVVIETCLVEYIEKTPIPARADGSLMDLKFNEGDIVSKGDLLATIDDTAARLAVEAKKAEHKEAMLNASNDVNIRNAKNTEKLARAELKSFEELLKQGAIPFWEMKKKEFEADRAVLSIELSEMEHKVAQVQMIAKRTELEMAEFELTKRQVTAPLTGQIEERVAQTGQWVQPGEPIATLIQMDKLRVAGDVKALDYPGLVRRGAPVEVKIFTQSDRDKSVNYSGKLGYVSLELNGRGECHVWVEVENQKIGDDWLIKPGMRAEIVIQRTAEIQ